MADRERQDRNIEKAYIIRGQEYRKEERLMSMLSLYTGTATECS